MRALLSDWTASATKAQRASFLASLSERELRTLAAHWPLWARSDQLEPPGDWTSWVVLGGRGAGKTRTGAEWVRARMEGTSPLARGACARIALVAETYHDARAVMIEGPSGLLAIAEPSFRPTLEASRRRLVWPNGAEARFYSSEDPEGLRGPQFDGAWADELGKWRHAQGTWDMLQFGLRLGRRPRQVVTTTPRPSLTLKTILADPGTVVTRAATSANRDNLSESFLTRIVERYRGTRLGRQELEGELLEDNPNGLWTYALIDSARCATAPSLTRIVVAVDPPASAGPDADECGIVIAGIDAEGAGYVLSDRSVQGLSPAGWAARAVAAFTDFEADRVVAEVNQGGEMVASVLRQVDPGVPIRMVRASRGKRARAEPVAALYEQGRVHHVGTHPALEDQMIGFGSENAHGSPDRVDALVWALSDLMLTRAATPRIRAI